MRTAFAVCRDLILESTVTFAANHRTEPDLMVTFAGTDEVAASFAEKPLQLRREIGHLSEGTAVSSALRQFVLARNELE